MPALWRTCRRDDLVGLIRLADAPPPAGRRATATGNEPVLTVAQVEEIARRVMRESA
jgi:hypothetical protein